MAIQGKKGKISARQRNKFRIRKKLLAVTQRPRMSVFRSNKNIYAQVLNDKSGTTMVSASTLEQEVQEEIKVVLAQPVKGQGKDHGKHEGKKGGAKEGEEAPAPVARPSSAKSVVAAKAVGRVIAKRCLAKDIKSVVFDRNGFIYHGRVKAVADGAREGGLLF